MSKSFKSAMTDRTLQVEVYHDLPHIAIEGNASAADGFFYAIADAPALALAILEAAYPPADYVLDGSPEAFLAVSAEYLRKASSAIESKSKEAADRAALEADAWTLYESAFPDDHPYPNFERFPEHLRDAWIRVALKAREMKGAGDE